MPPTRTSASSSVGPSVAAIRGTAKLEEDVYVRWARIRSPRRDGELPHTAEIAAVQSQIDDDVETHWRIRLSLCPGRIGNFVLDTAFPTRRVHMPRISEFFGIIIAMYYNDHTPPHFHASYAEYEATVNIQTLEVIAGSLPTRALGLVMEWAAMHRQELRENWAAARRGVPLSPIDDLD